MIRKLINAGVDVARINFPHGEPEDAEVIGKAHCIE